MARLRSGRCSSQSLIGARSPAAAPVSCAPAMRRPIPSRSIAFAAWVSESSPREMTAMRSAISKISSRSWLITSTAAPARAMSMRAWRMRAAAPASTPQVGWLITTMARTAIELPSEDELLEVSPGERARLRIGMAGAHVEGPHHALAHPRGSGGGGRSPRAPSPRQRCGRVSSTLSESSRLGSALCPSRSSGTKAAPRRRPRGDALSTAGHAGECHARLGRGEALSGKRVEELRLSVARHACDRDHLARSHLEGDVVQAHPEGALRGKGQVRDRQHDRVLALARFRAHLVHVRPHHEAGQGSGGLPRGIHVRGDPAVTQDGGVVAQALHLFQPVRDVEHRAALAGEAAQGDEELIGLLRSEHRGRFVHDEQARLLQQAAHDLDALALAHREIRDQGVRGPAAGRTPARPPRCAPRAPPGRRRRAGRARCSPPP